MSFRPYAAYKHGGAEWLGEVPEHWEIVPLGRTASAPGALFIDGDWIESKDLAGDGVRYITTGNVGEGKYKEQGLGYITEAKFHELRCTEVLPGDVLISRLNLPIGRACLAPDLGGRVVTSVDNVIVRTNTEFNRQFLVFLLSCKSHFANMENLARGTTMQRISRSALERVRFAFPPVEEQGVIASFLDCETAKIDALVAEQKKLIALLKEKRQAVISHAVTKGLDPSVPMKDSGADWMGHVPAHWQVTRLAHGASIENGTTPSRNNPAYWIDGDVPWLSSGEVNQYRITEATEFITAQALQQCSLRLLPKGTIVIGMIGQGKTRGLAASLEIEASINQNLAAIIPGKKLASDYLLYVFQSVYEYLREFGRGGNQAALNCEILAALRIPFPPLGEQLRICEYLEARLNQFVTLTAGAERAIELLQERRMALISAAVTGKIKVTAD